MPHPTRRIAIRVTIKKNVHVTAVTPGKKEGHVEYSYRHDDFVFSDDDDQIGRATSYEEYAQHHDRELWYWEGYYLKLTSW